MRNIKHLIFLVGTFLLCTVVTAKSKTQEVYMFGIAASFGDSIVYFTDIQIISGNEVLSKNGFLEARNQYAYQLKNYVENSENLPNRTCAIFFDKKKSKLEKKYIKLKNQYSKDKSVLYRNLDSGKFKFVKFGE